MKLDGGTLNDGTTWNWGYESPDQISGDSLQFHAAGASRLEQETSDQARVIPGADESAGIAPVVRLDWSGASDAPASLGFAAQYSYLAVDGGVRGSNFVARQGAASRDMQLTDTYDLSGIVPPLAPYEGSLGGPGPVIDNAPMSRRLSKAGVLERDEATFFNRVEERLEIDLHTITLGPTLSLRSGAVRLSLEPALALNVVHWEATHRETLHLSRGGRESSPFARWEDRAGGTTLLPAFQLQCGVSVDFTPEWGVEIFGAHSWSDSLNAHVGPSSVSFDPSGWSAGLMFTFRL